MSTPAKEIDHFLQRHSSNGSNVFQKLTESLGKTNAPMQLKQAVTDVLEQVMELRRIREIEQTKRVEIIARKETAIAAINAQKEVILECMRHTFAERAAVLQANFKALDYALECGDTTKLSMALGSMVQVIQTSPFQAIQQIVESKGTLRLE